MTTAGSHDMTGQFNEMQIRAWARRIGLRLVKAARGPFYMLEDARREPDPEGDGADLVVFGALVPGAVGGDGITPNATLMEVWQWLDAEARA